VAWEIIIIIIIIIIMTEKATEIKEGQKSVGLLVPSFFLFINSVLYTPLGSEILSSVPPLKTFI
jgi:hypothetical protein